MSIFAGQIIHLGGLHVIDRIQTAGLGQVRVPIDTVREIGNPNVVDQVPQDPDFTFSMESFDVTTDIEAWLSGKVGAAASGSSPAAADAAGTEYPFQGMMGAVSIPSPWKDPATGSAGTVNAGHLIPGYFPTRLRYNFGLTADAQQMAELHGGSFYYANGAPEEEIRAGDGATVAFTTTDPVIQHRIGGVLGTTFRYVFGVIVGGVLQIEGIDYTVVGTPPPGAPATALVTFTTAPTAGAQIRYSYFTTAQKAWPDTSHVSVAVKPAAVRSRNICVYVGLGAGRTRLGGVQDFQLDAVFNSQMERELCNSEIIGRTLLGRDVTGQITFRAKDKDALLNLLALVTGVAKTEVTGYLSTNPVQLQVQIQNPKNPGAILKTLYVPDAIFQPPATNPRVNQATDFVLEYTSQSGSFSAYKGLPAGF